MKSWYGLIIILFIFPVVVRSEVPPVSISTPPSEAWIGERIPFSISLRANGAFAGSAKFDLPELPGVLFVKLGNPVVSSEKREGNTWFVQTHEFALFSQREGLLEVSPFSARFSYNQGFRGASTEQQAEVLEAQIPPWTIEVRRPTGAENIGFLVSTNTLYVQDSWDPIPGAVKIGAIVKRTITQQASEVSGMALIPFPNKPPDGVRAYPGTADVQDRIERGDFLGKRQETITYLFTQPGIVTFPEVPYTWWNPTTETLESTILRAVNFEVTPAGDSFAGVTINDHSFPLALLFSLLCLFGISIATRRVLGELLRRYWRVLNPIERGVERQLMRACRRNDSAAAQTAWYEWRRTQKSVAPLPPELREAIIQLERQHFSNISNGTWKGAKLERAFRDFLSSRKKRSQQNATSALPLLNPEEVC